MGRKGVPPLSSETRSTEGRSCGAAMVPAKGRPGIYNRMKAGDREVGGQGFSLAKDKVDFTGIGFLKESISLT